MESKTVITIETIVNASAEKVWQHLTLPEHIRNWNFASDDWHAPHAENDLREGGRFSSRMESKDGSMGFDFGGKYDVIRDKEYIEYTIDDGRKVYIDFGAVGNHTKVTERFEAENQNPMELQKAGWQAILDNFKRYSEGK